jgi:methylmalonyl-CoA/ethylmalonyl-CoA epimerase
MGDEIRAWRVVRIHHVAFAHGSDLTCVDRLGELLDETPSEERFPGFVERMFGLEESWVQTLEADGDGVVQKFLDRRGPALHHIAFQVDELQAALDDLRRRGYRLVDEEPKSGGMGSLIAFIHPSAFGGLLVELVEPGREAESG